MKGDEELLPSVISSEGCTSNDKTDQDIQLPWKE